VNARVLTSPGVDGRAAGRAEHISIEADNDYLAPPPVRKVRAKYLLESSMRKCSTELALLDDYYVQVHSRRARKEPLRYTIDLRFLNSQPVRVRHIAWMWFVASAVLWLAAAAGVWLAAAAETKFASPLFIGGCIAALCAIVAAFIGVRGTSETLEFRSVNGGAPLVSVLGGLGSTKAGKSFFVAMIKDIAAAKAARPQQKQQWLRDEMREHHRLREIGALSEADYEASKARILKAHS